MFLEFLSEFVQGLLLAFAPILASLIAAWVLAKAREAWVDLKAAGPDIEWILKSAADIAVRAAEQAKMAELIKDKKAYALDIAEKWLLEKGVTVDLALIDAAIEAAVLSEFNKPQTE